MIIEQYRQVLVILYVKPTLLGAEVVAAILTVSSLYDDSQVYLLPIWRESACHEITTDSSSSSHLSLHKHLILVSFLIAAPDVGVLGHFEFLYHKYSFEVFNLYTYI